MPTTNYERMTVEWDTIQVGMAIEVNDVFYTVVHRDGGTFGIVAYGTREIVYGQPPLHSDVTRMVEHDATITMEQAVSTVETVLAAPPAAQSAPPGVTAPPAPAASPAPVQTQPQAVSGTTTRPLLKMTDEKSWCQCRKPTNFERSKVDPDIWICTTCKAPNREATNRVAEAHAILDAPRALAPCESAAVEAAASTPVETPAALAAETSDLGGKDELRNVIGSTLGIVERQPGSREMSLVRTKLQEAMMWVEYAIRIEEEQ